jgi:hypothetical protein
MLVIKIIIINFKKNLTYQRVLMRPGGRCGGGSGGVVVVTAVVKGSDVR